MILGCWSGDLCPVNSLMLPTVSSSGAPMQTEGDRSTERRPPQSSRAPESGKGGFQKQRTLSSGVYTSLYKRIKSSINMQQSPTQAWGGQRGWEGVGEDRVISHLGPDEGGGGKDCPGAQLEGWIDPVAPPRGPSSGQKGAAWELRAPSVGDPGSAPGPWLAPRRLQPARGRSGGGRLGATPPAVPLRVTFALCKSPTPATSRGKTRYPTRQQCHLSGNPPGIFLSCRKSSRIGRLNKTGLFAYHLFACICLWAEGKLTMIHSEFQCQKTEN